MTLRIYRLDSSTGRPTGEDRWRAIYPGTPSAGPYPTRFPPCQCPRCRA